MKRLGAARARSLLRAMRGPRVLVLGDVMLDEFIWGRVARISPEAPVPVVQVVRETFHIGGAGNVARNVLSLGGEAVLVGTVGDDAAGTRIQADLAGAGVISGLVVTGAARPTTVKTRVIAHHQQVVRADRESTDDVPREVEDRILERVTDALRQCRVLVVSDYQKGVITPRIMRRAAAAAHQRGVPVLVDPKVPHLPLFRGVALVKPNAPAAEEATGIPIRDEASLHRAGARLLKLLRCGAVLITRGEHGMSLFQADRPPAHAPTAAREVFDVTGAGDTVLATLGLATAAGAELTEAVRLANHAAGIVVGKLGTATVAAEELSEAVAGVPR